MIYEDLKKNKNLIIISLLIIIILILYFKNKNEYLTSTESILNIAKIYADVSGTVSFNNLQTNNLQSNNLLTNELDILGKLKIKDNNIDASANINVNNLKVINNLDISGTLNILKVYYTCVINGTLNISVINQNMVPNSLSTQHMNITSNKWWNSDMKITSISNDYNNTISNNTNGIFTGFDKNKLYKLYACIHLSIGLKGISKSTDSWTIRWKKSNGEEISTAYLPSQLSKNLTLSTVIFATGSDSYILTLQRYGDSSYYTSIYASITITVTEI